MASSKTHLTWNPRHPEATYRGSVGWNLTLHGVRGWPTSVCIPHRSRSSRLAPLLPRNSSSLPAAAYLQDAPGFQANDLDRVVAMGGRKRFPAHKARPRQQPDLLAVIVAYLLCVNAPVGADGDGNGRLGRRRQLKVPALVLFAAEERNSDRSALCS